MNIVIIYQFFQSEDEPGHSLTYNLTQNLALKGNKVTVVCSKIGYMKGNTANLSFKQKLLQKTKVGSVEVIRIWSYLGLHSSYMGRIFNYISSIVVRKTRLNYDSARPKNFSIICKEIEC